MAKKKRNLKKATHIELTSAQTVNPSSQSGAQAFSFVKPVLFLSVAALSAGYAINSLLLSNSNASTPQSEHNLPTEINHAADSSLATLTEVIYLTGKIIAYTAIYLPSLIGLAYYQRSQTTQQLALSIVAFQQLSFISPICAEVQAVSAVNINNILKKELEAKIHTIKEQINQFENSQSVKEILKKLTHLKNKYYEHVKASQVQNNIPAPNHVYGPKSAINTILNGLSLKKRQEKEEDWANFYAKEHDKLLDSPRYQSLVQNWHDLNLELLMQESTLESLERWLNLCTTLDNYADQIGIVEYYLDENTLYYRNPSYMTDLQYWDLYDKEDFAINFPLPNDLQHSTQIANLKAQASNAYHIPEKNINIVYQLIFMRNETNISTRVELAAIFEPETAPSPPPSSSNKQEL